MRGKLSENGRWILDRRKEPWGDPAWSKDHSSIYNAILIYSASTPQRLYVGAALYPDFKPYPAKKLGDDSLIKIAISECAEDIASMFAKDLEYEAKNGNNHSSYEQKIESSENNGNSLNTITAYDDVETKNDSRDQIESRLVSVPWVDVSTNAPGVTMMNSPVRSEKGYLGEVSTAGVLDSIVRDHEGSYVLNSVPLRDNLDLDHVLICRKGIFIIDSKMVKKGYLVDGSLTWYWGSKDNLNPHRSYEWIPYDVQNDLMKNRDLIKQRLRDRGYGNVPDTTGLIIPLIAMWDGKARLRSTGSTRPSVPFINANDSGLYHFINDDITHPVILTQPLVDALYADMSRSTFWL